ncbi:MAG: hypothetical protein H6815_09940 [Phycisphaeraceae bacterium]|nr:hypothetical protein [Phycisphaerales bacterium]MCB9860758.1 hypothetical protein [Phycisphaeraceae bacterium]
MRVRISKLVNFAIVAVCVAGVMHSASTATAQSSTGKKKVLQLPIRTDGPKRLDPAQGSTTYDNMAIVQMYETLLINKYTNPLEIEPLLLAEMPTTEDDGKTWHFKLKDGVVFYNPHKENLFGGSKTRPLTTDDVFYSLKRLADKKNQLKNWWLLENTIVGFDEYKETQNESAYFDYDAPVSGFRKISDSEFEIELVKPVYRFLYILSMFQTSIVPREAVEAFGDDFSFKPVGTGPFTLDTWVPKISLTLNRNPHYHDVRYPARDDWSRDDRRLRMHRAAGEQVPFVDRIEFTMFIEDQPMWLTFSQNDIAYTEVPAEYFEKAFDKRTRELRSELANRGVRSHSNMLLDFIFRHFNMEDPILGMYEEDGSYSEKHRAFRQAICYAVDLDEFNETFYNGLNVVYDGPIPPGLDGFPSERPESSSRGLDLVKARQKLVEAGFTVVNGKATDAPTIDFYTSRGGNNQEQTEMLERQLAEIGISINKNLVDFSTLIEFVDNKKAQFFGFAWSSDYPDAENNLALFYGPNESPGSNHGNYKRPEYDAMYQNIITMPPSSERTEIYVTMRDMILEDAPYVGSMARERFYLINPWALNFKPTERYWSWFKFVDVDDSLR